MFDDRHVNRFIMPSGVASPALRGYPQQQINDALQRDAENLKRIQRGIRAS